MDKNPELIQPEDWMHPIAGGRAVPVFLIHDGGGTTFAYHCLDPLQRPVYGIHNPHFRTQEIFEGGIAEMGRLYSKYIKEAIAEPGFPTRRNQDGSVDILLGGWSMGGLLSLEVARQLADDCSLRIIGILMMDSVCTIKNSSNPLVAPTNTSEEGKTKNQVLSMRSMTEARRMLATWDLPVWDGHLTGKRPKMSLIRARGTVPMDGAGVSLVDAHREERNLGWDRYEENMFTEVVDVDGHHFDMFSFDHIPGVTEAIKKSLEKLEVASY
ncbi:Alpha/Beta hydrolase protein [Thelonectria olida]|uniref:Alpha/Beta hydrolase protein n=1 Tax=Thelonectria olida TaxID=1576542 RepID=A0A9P8W442_9HYPO|nr:Alpha/Beta hydrolase protein [Thelonectria olida]